MRLQQWSALLLCDYGIFVKDKKTSIFHLGSMTESSSQYSPSFWARRNSHFSANEIGLSVGAILVS